MTGKPRTYTIGRAPGSEIHLRDDSVSRRHAELTIGRSGSYFLVDCASTHGTAIVRDGHAQPLRQGYLTVSDTILIGTVRISLSQLLERRRPERVGENKPAAGPGTDGVPSMDGPSGKFGGGGVPVKPDDRPHGRVRRNPSTGELEGF